MNGNLFKPKWEVSFENSYYSFDVTLQLELQIGSEVSDVRFGDTINPSLGA